MTSRQQHQQQHQQQYYPSTQFQEGHSAPSDANEWNTYNDQSRKQGTSSVSSFKSWTSTDPSQYQPHTRHNSSQPPPRGASASTRNRSDSNISNVSNGFSYGVVNTNNGNNDYSSNHMSHMSHASQKSNSSTSYAHTHSPPYHQQYQQQQHQGYNNIHQRQDEPSFSRGSSNGSSRSDHIANGGYGPPIQAEDRIQQGKQSSEYYANGSDNYHPSHRQNRQSPPAQQDPSISQSLMQSLDQFHDPNGSPRMAARSAPRRREQTQATITNDGDLPSLDDYEAMLQQMTSPGLGPTSPREARAARRSEKSDNEREMRTERRPRQARRQKEQQQQHDQLDRSERESNDAVSRENGVESSHHAGRHGNQLSASSIDKKNRRRSSLPPSFTEFPSKLLTDLKRRSGGYQSPIETVPEVPLHVPTDRSDKRHSWEDDSIVPRNDLIYPKDPLSQKAPAYQDINGFSHGSDKALLHVDDDDDTRSGLSDSAERQRLDHQRRNKRKSPRLSQLGSKPPLTTRSHLRLSHTLSQSDADEAMAISRSILKDDDHQDMASTSVTVTGPRPDENGRQIEQFQQELQQLQNLTPSSRHLHSGTAKSSANNTSPATSRSRSTTPLGMVAEEVSPSHPGPPSRQQLLASLEDGGPRSTTPTNSRSRPTTPINGIRPPPGPAPGNGNNSSASSSPIIIRKGSPAMGRRVKPSPPASSAIQPPIMTRPRAGSVASVNSANSLSSFNLESALHYAAPSLPLPSLPPPPTGAPPSSFTGELSSGSHRPRKASGSKELVIPTSQLLSENGGLASTFELRTELEELRMQLIERDETVTRMMMEKQEQENHSKQDDTRQSEILSLETARSNLERELGSAKDEIDRLQRMLANQENAAIATVAADNQERSQGQEREDALLREVESLRAERAAQQEAHSALERELEAFTARSQQEEAQYRTLQDTVQRLTSKTSRLEAQHAAEIQQLQRDHEEIMEKVVVEHAEALTDLVERSRNESEDQFLRWREDLETGIQKEKQEALAREKVLKARLEEQMARNDQLEKKMLALERAQAAHDEEKESWTRTNKSLERQLTMEKLQQEEHLYRIEEAEKETQRLRAILSDLDLSAQFSRDNEDGYGRDDIHAMYEAQRQKWMDQIQLLERKMTKTEEDATAIMNKNMELMVALEMAQSAQPS
ncbi:hypothetical protein BGZ51_004351 [Haplosporangium sp. Z 767]|nr:hypothetical protein BGZ51_004351 [Haplosporangium sp. Z 767]